MKNWSADIAFVDHCKESLKFLLFFVCSSLFLLCNELPLQVTFLLQHLGILFLYNELPFQAAFLLQHLSLSVFCNELPLQVVFCDSTLASRFWWCFLNLLCFLCSLKLQLHFLLDFQFMFIMSYQTS